MKNGRYQARNKGESRLVRFFTLISQPTLIYGMGFGVILTIAFLVTMQLGVVKNVLAGIMALLFLSTFGALFLFFIARSFGDRLLFKGRLSQNKKEEGLLATLVDIRAYFSDTPTDDEKRDQIESRLNASLTNAFGAVGAALGRYYSLVFLVSVLGGAATFAIFAATFIQAERLEVQNRLIESQLHLAEAQRQTALAISLESLEAQLELLQKEKGEIVLPEALALKIVALSRTFRPYRFVEYALQGSINVVQVDLLPSDDTFGARLTETPLSQERSRLLAQIIYSGINNLEVLHQKRPSFQFADFREYFLGNAALDCFDLRGGDFRESYAFASSFNGANLAEARFGYAALIGANFSSATDEAPSCPRAQGSLVIDTTTNLSGADFSFARLNQASFDGARLTNTDFSNSILFGATFVGADPSTVNFDGAVVASSGGEMTIEELSNGFFGEAQSTHKETFLVGWKLVAEKINHPFLNDPGVDDTVYYLLRRRE